MARLAGSETKLIEADRKVEALANLQGTCWAYACTKSVIPGYIYIERMKGQDKRLQGNAGGLAQTLDSGLMWFLHRP